MDNLSAFRSMPSAKIRELERRTGCQLKRKPKQFRLKKLGACWLVEPPSSEVCCSLAYWVLVSIIVTAYRYGQAYYTCNTVMDKRNHNAAVFNSKKRVIFNTPPLLITSCQNENIATPSFVGYLRPWSQHFKHIKISHSTWEASIYDQRLDMLSYICMWYKDLATGKSARRPATVFLLSRLQFGTIKWVVYWVRRRGVADRGSLPSERTGHLFKSRHLANPPLKAEWELSTGVDVSTRTVRRRLCENGLKGCRAREKPLVAQAQTQKLDCCPMAKSTVLRWKPLWCE